MKTLPNKTNSPPGGWRYQVPETGQVFTNVSEDALIEQVIAHYNANHLPHPPHLPELIEAYICTNTDDWCVEENPKPVKGWLATAKTTFSRLVQGTTTLAKWKVKYGGQLVDMKLADQRALVCLGCKQHREPEGCQGCKAGAVRDAVNYVIGNRRTTHHDKLLACAVCDCSLQAKVQLPHEALWNEMPEGQKEALPDTCWLVTEAKQ